jgi:hypothetical protein
LLHGPVCSYINIYDYINSGAYHLLEAFFTNTKSEVSDACSGSRIEIWKTEKNESSLHSVVPSLFLLRDLCWADTGTSTNSDDILRHEYNLIALTIDGDIDLWTFTVPGEEVTAVFFQF